MTKVDCELDGISKGNSHDLKWSTKQSCM